MVESKSEEGLGSSIATVTARGPQSLRCRCRVQTKQLIVYITKEGKAKPIGAKQFCAFPNQPESVGFAKLFC